MYEHVMKTSNYTVFIMPKPFMFSYIIVWYAVDRTLQTTSAYSLLQTVRKQVLLFVSSSYYKFSGKHMFRARYFDKMVIFWGITEMDATRPNYLYLVEIGIWICWAVQTQKRSAVTAIMIYVLTCP